MKASKINKGVNILQLTSGRELIGTVWRDPRMLNDDNITLKSALNIFYQRTPEGTSIGMAPLSMLDRNTAEGIDLDINTDHILHAFEAPSEIEAEYIKATTGIQLAKSFG